MQETVVILLFVFHTDYTPAYHLELAQLGSARPMILPLTFVRWRTLG
jgi:hypothetical protein